MRIFIFTILALLSSLEASAQEAAQSQENAASQRTEQSADKQRSFSPVAQRKEDVRPSLADQKHEAHDSQSNEKFEQHKTPVFETSDWIAIILGMAALIFTGIGIRQNKKSNQSQNRAYVHASKAKFIRDIFGLRISLEGSNTGQTPAKWWETSFKCGTYEPAETELESQLKFETLSDFSRWPALANGFPLTAGLSCPDGENLIIAAQQRRGLCFFIYGIIRYETMFGEIFESQFVFYHPNPSVGSYLSRPNIKIETYSKLKSV